jgi:hypothetical protein
MVIILISSVYRLLTLGERQWQKVPLLPYYKYPLLYASSRSSVVEYSTHNPDIKGLNPAGTRREKMAKRAFIILPL